MSLRRNIRQRLPIGRLADRSGFTLVETLVAFVVLATVLSVLFRSVVGLRSGAAAFDARGHADVVARAILDQALTARDLTNGTTSGTRDGRHWTLQATPVDLASQMPQPPVDTDSLSATNQQGDNQQGANQPSTEPQATKPPMWAPQRLVVRVETGGTPVEVETIRLAKVPRDAP